MPDKDTNTVTVPIPAGDHNPEVAVLEKQSRFEDEVLPANPPTGLRASNTVESLKPREVNAEFHTTQAPPVTLPANSGSVLRVVPKTDSSVRELVPTPGLPQQVWDALKESQTATDNNYYHGPANVLPVNWPEAKATPAGEKIRPSNLGEFPSKIAAPVKVSIPKPSYVPKKDSLEVRVERLEEQIDGLLDRIARYNQKSSHKL